MVLVPVALVAVVGVVLSSRAGAGGEWGCERFAFTAADYASEATGGHDSQRGAVREWAELLSQDGNFDGSVLLAALDSRSGPDRYDPETKLFLDDKVQVRFGVGQQSDGTWRVGNMEYCA